MLYLKSALTVTRRAIYEKGWGVIAEPRLAHANADYFAEPNRFDPDRFYQTGERGDRMNLFLSAVGFMPAWGHNWRC